MKCHFCQHLLPEGSRSCPRCGAPASAPVTPVVPVPASGTSTESDGRTVMRSGVTPQTGPAIMPGVWLPPAAPVPRTVGPAVTPAEPAASGPRGAAPMASAAGWAVPEPPRGMPHQPPSPGMPVAPAASPRGRGSERPASGPAPAWQAAPAAPPRTVGPAPAGLQHDLASLGARFGGTLLDLLMLAALELLALVVARLFVPDAVRDPGIVGAVSWGGVAVFLLYFGLANGRGQTLGKRLVGTRVVHVRTGEPIGAVRGLARAGVMALEQIPLGLGYLSVLGANRRAWHDRVALSVVVKVPPRPRTPQA